MLLKAKSDFQIHNLFILFFSIFISSFSFELGLTLKSTLIQLSSAGVIVMEFIMWNMAINDLLCFTLGTVDQTCALRHVMRVLWLKRDWGDLLKVQHEFQVNQLKQFYSGYSENNRPIERNVSLMGFCSREKTNI